MSREDNMIELKVEGMSCMHCVKAVTEALAAVPGVAGAPRVSLEQGTAAVEGAPDADALVAAVKEAGYRADVRG
jgi:copper chaperone